MSDPYGSENDELIKLDYDLNIIRIDSEVAAINDPIRGRVVMLDSQSDRITILTSDDRILDFIADEVAVIEDSDS